MSSSEQHHGFHNRWKQKEPQFKLTSLLQTWYIDQKKKEEGSNNSVSSLTVIYLDCEQPRPATSFIMNQTPLHCEDREGPEFKYGLSVAV